MIKVKFIQCPVNGCIKINEEGCNTCPVYQAYERGKEERPTGEWIDFARWVTKEVLDEHFEDNSGAFAEIACRKLVKLGLVEVKDNVYKRKGGAE